MEDRYAGLTLLKTSGKARVYAAPLPATQEDRDKVASDLYRVAWKIWRSLPAEEKIKANELYGTKVTD